MNNSVLKKGKHSEIKVRNILFNQLEEVMMKKENNAYIGINGATFTPRTAKKEKNIKIKTRRSKQIKSNNDKNDLNEEVDVEPTILLSSAIDDIVSVSVCPY